MSGGTVSLTFDDGPDPVWTPRVLEALAAAGAKATFFVITSRVRRHPQVLAQITAAGHVIALHCDEHRRHPQMRPADIARDTDIALAELRGRGVRPTQWRVPWGDQAPSTASIAAARGLQLVHWTADTEDWRGGSAADMLERVRPQLVDGAIVLAHDALGPGATRRSCRQTAILVPALVTEIRVRGLRCAPVGAAVAA